MTSTEILIQNNEGLHARSATYFIQKANSYKSSVKIKNGSRTANAKSLLGVLSLGVSKGDIVVIEADGTDEAEAIEGISALINSGIAD